MSFALVGQVAGSYFFGPWGALGGALLGGAIDAKLAPGPDAGDLSAPSVSLGTRIPRVYGTVRVPVHPISISDYIATEHGGKGTPEPASLTFSLDTLGVIADGSNVQAILRVWANKKLVDTRHGSSSTTALANTASPDWCTSWNFYDGNPTQMPAPLYEDRVTTANALAYRGMATMEIAGLACGGSKAPPAIEVEVATNVSGTYQVLPAGEVVGWTSGSGTVPGLTPTIPSGVQAGDAMTLRFVCHQAQGTPVFADGWADAVVCNTLESSGAIRLIICSRIATGDANDALTSFSLAFAHPVVWTMDVLRGEVDSHFAVGMVGGGTDYSETLEAPGNANPSSITKPGGTSQYVVATAVIHTSDPLATLDSDPPGYTHGANVRADLGGGYSWHIRTAYKLVAGTSENPGSFGVGNNNFTGSVVNTLGITYRGTPTATGLTPLPELLSDIILAELALDPEFDPADVDVTDVDDIEVTGYTAIGPASETIAELCRMYYVDVVPGNPIKFVKLGKAVVTTIDNVQTGVAVDQPGERFAGLKRENADETVAVAAIRYPLIDRDHEPGYERGDRLTAQSDDSTAITTRVVFTAEEAKGRALAFTLMNRVKRHKASIVISDKFAAVEPGDCATVEDNDGNTMRLNARRLNYADGVKSIEWELDDTTALVQTGITDTGYTPNYNPTPPADVTLYLLDAPIFRDVDNSYGLYACVTATGDWRFADVFKSTDALAYTNVGRLTNRATAGVTSGALADFTGWGWDNVSTLTVTFDEGSGGTPSSSTVAGVEADATVNVALVGAHGRWEVIRFVNAPLVSGTTHLFSKFLRGQFGTEANNGTHQVGDTFILVQPNGMLRIAGTLSDVGVSRSYKAVAAGKQIASVTAQALTTEEVGLTPYAPVDLRIDEDGDLVWNRRTRLESRFLFGAEIPLGEASEAYDVQILNGGTETASGTVTTPEFVSAEVVATRTARVWQLSASIGRGNQAEEVL